VSKSLVPNPDRAQGVISKAKSEGVAFVAGAVTIGALVPFFGWVLGPIIGAGGYLGYRFLRRKK
jgi:hypothetical protein